MNIPQAAAAAQLVIDELGLPTPNGLILAQEARSGELPSTYGKLHVDLNKAYGVSIFYPPELNALAFDLYAGRPLGPVTGQAQPKLAAGTPLEFTLASRWADFLQTTVAPAAAQPLPWPQVPIFREWRLFIPLTVR